MENAPRPVLIASRRTVIEQGSFLRHLLAGLGERSVPAALIYPPGTEMALDEAMATTVVTHPAIDLPGLDRFGIQSLAARLADFRPTVLHGLCEHQLGLVRRLAARLGVPWVQSINSLVPAWRRLSLSYGRCDLFAAATETIGRRIAHVCASLADRIAQLPPGTVAADAIVCMSDPARPAGIVVAPGFDRASDLAGFFKAARALLADGHEFVVVVMGLGRGERRLRHLLAREDLTETVTLLPMLSSWRSVLAAGDIFVQPRPLASFSGYLLEAMGLGMAVAACQGQLDDPIIPNQTAAVFEPDDADNIGRTLAGLLGDHDTACRLARTAQEHVRASYSVDAMASAALTCYERAARSFVA